MRERGEGEQKREGERRRRCGGTSWVYLARENGGGFIDGLLIDCLINPLSSNKLSADTLPSDKLLCDKLFFANRLVIDCLLHVVSCRQLIHH